MAERKRDLPGIYIGKKGDPLGDVLELFAKKSIFIRPNTISRIRSGIRSGAKTSSLLLLNEVFQAKNPLSKCELFGNIAQTGQEIRTSQVKYPRRFLSEGFTLAIAESLTLRDQDVRSCIRSMRADLVLACIEDPEPELVGRFVQSAESYLQAYINPPSTRSADFKRSIDTNWNRHSIQDYYRMLYEVRRSRQVGSWTPYEVDIFAFFYDRQAASKEFTPLDKLVETSYRPFKSNDGLVADIRERSATDFNEDALMAYVNAHVFGLPANPLLAKTPGGR